MAIIKCKVCGGSFEVSLDAATAVCEYCGTLITIHASEKKDSMEQALIKKAFIQMSDLKYLEAKETLNKAMDIEPENPDIYMGLLLCNFTEFRIFSKDEFFNRLGSIGFVEYIESDSNYDKFLKFSDEEQRASIEEKHSAAKNRLESRNQNNILLDENCSHNCETKLDQAWLGSRIKLDRHFKSHLVILSYDNTAHFFGKPFQKCSIGTKLWTDIRTLDLGSESVIGIKNNGEVITAWNNYDPLGHDEKRWKDVKALMNNGFEYYGFRNDESLITNAVDNNFKQLSGIKKLSARADAVLLKNGSMLLFDSIKKEFVNYKTGVQDFFYVDYFGDPIVVVKNADDSFSTNYDYFNKTGNLSSWKNIINVVVTQDSVYGLKADGTVAVAGMNEEASLWTDIVRIGAKDGIVWGIRRNGTVEMTFDAYFVGTYDEISKRYLDFVDNITDVEYLVPMFVSGVAPTVNLIVVKKDGSIYDSCHQWDLSTIKIFLTSEEKESKYEKACGFLNDGSEESYANAYHIFKALNGYKESLNLCERSKKAYWKSRNIRESKEKIHELELEIDKTNNHLSSLGFFEFDAKRSDNEKLAYLNAQIWKLEDNINKMSSD